MFNPMKRLLTKYLLIPATLIFLSGCDPRALVELIAEADKPENKRSESGPKENIDEAELQAGIDLVDATDPAVEGLDSFTDNVNDLFQQAKFSELEDIASQTREETKPMGYGSWKITHFYYSLGMNRNEKDEVEWKRHENLLKDWLAQLPDSYTARIAYVNIHIACHFIFIQKKST